jgi:hypothetical protein
LVDFGEQRNRGGVGDPHEDDNPLPKITARVFSLGLLVTQHTISIDPEHLIRQVVDGACGASVGAGVGDEAWEITTKPCFHGQVERRDWRMRVAWRLTQQAMIGNIGVGVGAGNTEPVKEWLHGIGLSDGVVSRTDKAADRFPSLAGGHGWVGQRNRGKLWR